MYHMYVIRSLCIYPNHAVQKGIFNIRSCFRICKMYQTHWLITDDTSGIKALSYLKQNTRDRRIIWTSAKYSASLQHGEHNNVLVNP